MTGEVDRNRDEKRLFGGAERDRTAGLLVANEALSQLSYSPTTSSILSAASVSRKCPMVTRSQSPGVGKGGAPRAGVVESVKRKDRLVQAGKQGNLQVAAGYKSRHPLRAFGAAKRVAMRKSPFRRHAEAVKIALYPRVDVGIEDCRNFSRFESADMRNRKRGEVEVDLRFRDGDVACNGPRIGAGGTPEALVLRVERNSKSDGQHKNGGDFLKLHIFQGG